MCANKESKPFSKYSRHLNFQIIGWKSDFLWLRQSANPIGSELTQCSIYGTKSHFCLFCFWSSIYFTLFVCLSLCFHSLHLQNSMSLRSIPINCWYSANNDHWHALLLIWTAILFTLLLSTFLFYLFYLSKISLTIIQSISWWVLGCDILTIRLWHIHSWALCDIEI